ncbi:MAG: L-threonylcarbamoyladenylate synthase [Chloroflexota bacterium]|jgi:L-threonylcarbamoyladenylate synthase
METILLDANAPDAIREAADFVRAGQLVAFPTDTLYGVGSSIDDGRPISRLFVAKERSLAKGIPILLADAGDVDLVAADVPPVARDFMTRYWPGPLTIIVARRPGLPAVLAPGNSVAVRVPDHPVARRFIRAAGGAVAATSANLSGRQPALNAGEAMAALGGRIAAVLDGGPVRVGQASTIVDCTADPPLIVRQGPVPASALSARAASQS